MTRTLLEGRCKCLAGCPAAPSVAVTPSPGGNEQHRPPPARAAAPGPGGARLVLSRGEKNAFKNPDEDQF